MDDVRLTMPEVPVRGVNNSEMSATITSKNRSSVFSEMNKESFLGTGVPDYKGPPMVTEIDWSKKIDNMEVKDVEGGERTVLTWDDINFFVPSGRGPVQHEGNVEMSPELLMRESLVEPDLD